MKNIKIIAAIILTFFIFACKKKEIPTNALVGEWELRESLNGQTGGRTVYAPGNGTMLKFSDTGYEVLQEGNSISKGTYAIRTYVAYITKQEEPQIVYDGRTDVVQSYYRIDGNNLSISVDANDGPGTVYARVR